MNNSRKAVLIALIVFTLVLTFYQVSRRINWDRQNKNYTVLVRYGDVTRTSPLFGSDPDVLAGELDTHGVDYVLFQVDLAGKGEPLLPDLSSTLSELGLGAALEVTNLQLADQQDVQALLDFLNSYSPQLLTLRSLQKTQLPAELEEWIRQNDPVLGTVEFRDDSLVQEVATMTGSSYVRVHRVFDKEVGTLSEEESVARYVRAVKERNIGAIEFRLPMNKDLENTLGQLDEIRSRLGEQGFQDVGIENAKGAVGQLETPKWLITLLITGSLTATLLLLFLGHLPNRLIQLLLFAIAVVLTLIGLWLFPVFTRQTAGFLLALGGPVAAYRLLTTYGLSFQDRETTLLSPFVDLLFVSAVSTAFGLAISAILTDGIFILKLEQFRGVKVSLFLPLLFIGLIYLFQAGTNLKNWGPGGFKWLIIVGFGALVVFLLLRSGNFTFLESSELEDAFRRWLERNLSVRPRFKEFALGHPAAILWLYLVNRYRSKFNSFQVGLALLGFIGQISVINTFAHIHSPLIISLMRTGNGLAGGFVLGGTLLLVFFGGERLWTILNR